MRKITELLLEDLLVLQTHMAGPPRLSCYNALEPVFHVCEGLVSCRLTSALKAEITF